MSLTSEAKPLIESRKFEEVEALWLARLESNISDVEDFLATARALRKAEERGRSDALLGLLGDALVAREDWAGRLKVLKEIGRLAKQPANLRKEFEEALTGTYSSRPNFSRVMEHVKFSDPSGNPVEKAEKVDGALLYDEGEVYFMAGRGAGAVIELNLDLGICRLDFERDKRVSVPLGAAQKFLIPLPPGHILREKIEDPEGLKATVAKSPAETFARLLQSFGRPMTASEVKDAMIGVVPEARWSSWWASARKNPQIIISGAGARANYSWSASSEAAEDTIRKDFGRAATRAKLELAKKHSARSSALADHFSQTLATQAAKEAKTDPALAWEILAVLEKLPGEFDTELDATEMLVGPLASRIVAAVSDRTLREKALRDIRERHPEWPKVFSEVFFIDEDPRILTLIMNELEVAHPRLCERLIDETLRYPRRHPKAFYWYCSRLAERDEIPEKAPYALLFQLLDAIGSDEFGPLKPRLREFFDKGALGIQIVMKTDNEEQARKLVDTLERYGLLEEYRRDILRTAALMKFPSLREPQVEVFYTTSESFAAKREELENLKKVEIPANSKALQEAREMGDLRENFEYKAARARAEYLSARVGELQADLARARVLDPDTVDISSVRIGTRIALRNGDESREVTILGPWESDPERGIYSSQADVSKAILGHTQGDIVSFMGNDYEIVGIAKWRE